MATITRPLSPPVADDVAATSRRLDTLLQAVQGEPGAVEAVELEATAGNETLKLRVPFGALELLRDLLHEMGKGNAVTVLPHHAELTTQEAADLLNVSRPFVVKLIDEGKLPARKVGTHRRIRLEDVMDYQRADDEQRRKLADELTREAQEMGLGYQ